ncbi:MAG: PIN domain-containing protein [Azospirillaceae bacterium]|nr:PIN domain-containing protein [Azospirillaceae bacterium]
MPGSFFDTNVLVYAASADAAKADRAEEVLGQGGAVSVQVLNELANIARRKMGLSWAEVRGLLDTVRALVTVHPLTVDIHDTGLDLAERHGLSLYDAMIVSAALHAGCDVLWSEDMQHGLVIAGQLRIVNPFRV